MGGLEESLKQARVLYAAGKYAEALAALDDGLAAAQGEDEELVLEAVLAAGSLEGLMAAAPDVLVARYSRADELAARLRPADPTTRVKIKHQLGMALHQSGDVDAGFDEWLAAADLARAVVDNDAQRSWVLLGLVPALLIAERFELACQLAREATTLNHAHRAQDRQWFMDRLFLAQALAGLGKDEEARLVIDDALAQRGARVKEPLIREAQRLRDRLSPKKL